MSERSKKQKTILTIGILLSLLNTALFPFMCSFVGMSSVSGDGFGRGMSGIVYGFLISPLILITGIILFSKVSKSTTDKLAVEQKAFIGGYLSLIPAMLIFGILLSLHDPRTSLMEASARGDVDTVVKLLKKQADIDKVVLYRGGSTHALAEAINNDQLEIVKLLINSGAYINIKPYPPLVLASKLGRYEIVKALIDNNANMEITIYYGDTALIAASKEGHLDIVNLLISNGANVSNDALRFACSNNHTDIVKLLLQNGTDPDSPLFQNLEHPEITSLLLLHGANIEKNDKNGNTPLIVATIYGHIDTIELLLKRGANISHRNYERKNAVEKATDLTKPTFREKALKKLPICELPSVDDFNKIILLLKNA